MKQRNSAFFVSLLLIATANATKPTLPTILDPMVTTPSTNIHSPFVRTGPTVQIGILLDTSNSMDGLINQAKDQLWKIVNEVAKANKYNREVTIQVGLFEYGKSSLPRYEGFLQMLSPLTSDLDRVSEELFGLRTKGGSEYAGKVILESVNRFAWSSHRDDLKLLIIAGNESFAQGSVPYRAAIAKAKENGIIVNTIFCGDSKRGRQLRWSDGARRGEGKYFTINQDDRRVYVATPYDDEIIVLGERLNDTYVGYGVRKVRVAQMRNRRKQDANTLSLSKGSYVERNLVKSKKQYAPASSDMVEAYTQNEASLGQIEKKMLPDAFKDKSKKEIKQIIKKKKKARETLQKQIKALEKKRAKHLATKSKEKGKDLGSAIIETIRKQAKENGFKFSN